jgi:hypothetical protein
MTGIIRINNISNSEIKQTRKKQKIKGMEVKNRKQVQKTGEKSKRLINCLYSYFKNSPKKLKIICDWDEVIQTHEPYALWLTSLSKEQKKQEYTNEKTEFSEYFKIF